MSTDNILQTVSILEGVSHRYDSRVLREYLIDRDILSNIENITQNQHTNHSSHLSIIENLITSRRLTFLSFFMLIYFAIFWSSVLLFYLLHDEYSTKFIFFPIGPALISMILVFGEYVIYKYLCRIVTIGRGLNSTPIFERIDQLQYDQGYLVVSSLFYSWAIRFLIFLKIHAILLYESEYSEPVFWLSLTLFIVYDLFFFGLLQFLSLFSLFVKLPYCPSLLNILSFFRLKLPTEFKLVLSVNRLHQNYLVRAMKLAIFSHLSLSMLMYKTIEYTCLPVYSAYLLHIHKSISDLIFCFGSNVLQVLLGVFFMLDFHFDLYVLVMVLLLMVTGMITWFTSVGSPSSLLEEEDEEIEFEYI